MYNSTKEYIKRKILLLIKQTNDIEHTNGQVTLDDIKICIGELENI